MQVLLALFILLLFHNTSCNYFKAPCSPNIDFTKWQKDSPSNSSYTLIQSHVYTRHGDRTQWQTTQCFNGPQPIWECSETIAIQPNTFPHNSYPAFSFQLSTMNGSNVLPGNCLIGQLTSIGYAQQIVNGQGIRQRYIDNYKLIPSSFEDASTIDKIILVRSDNSPRVQQSAMAFFEGLYSNMGNSTHTFVIPFETSDAYYQIMTPNQNVCPYLQTIREMKQKTSTYQDRWKTVTQPLLEQSQSFMATSNVTENQVFDCGTVWSCHNKSIPNGYTKQLYDQINSDFAWYGMFSTQFPDYINATKYNNGPFLKLVFSRLYNAMMVHEHNVISSDSYKMYLYGGHDSGLVQIIGALNYNFTEWVSYASIVTFELFKHKTDGNYYVLMSYNGKIVKPSMCDYDLCSWKRFEMFMNTVTPTQSECPGMRNIPSYAELVEEWNK